MANEKLAIADLFSRTSGDHDTVGSLFSHFGEQLVAHAGLQLGDRVLDVGAGTGASLFPAAATVGPTGRVVGIDLARGMIEVVQRSIERRGLGNVQALVADGDALPFEDQSFDAVLCAFTLFFFPDPARALKEFRRVLRNGGHLAITTFTKAGSASIDRSWQLISEQLPVPPPSVGPRFDDPGQLIGALASAGFVDVAVERLPFEVVLPSVQDWLAWLRTMEFRDYVDRMDEAARGQLADSARQQLATEASGEVRFHMDALITLARKPVDLF